MRVFLANNFTKQRQLGSWLRSSIPFKEWGYLDLIAQERIGIHPFGVKAHWPSRKIKKEAYSKLSCHYEKAISKNRFIVLECSLEIVLAPGNGV